MLERERHRHEVNWCLRARKDRGRRFVLDYFDQVEQHRGKALRAKLEADVIEQWSLGNRGDYNDWRAHPVA